MNLPALKTDDRLIGNEPRRVRPVRHINHEEDTRSQVLWRVARPVIAATLVTLFLFWYGMNTLSKNFVTGLLTIGWTLLHPLEASQNMDDFQHYVKNYHRAMISPKDRAAADN